jgi:hypothetical protein
MEKVYMKKTVYVMVLFVLLLSLIACGKKIKQTM